jgi:hypothetical protein
MRDFTFGGEARDLEFDLQGMNPDKYMELPDSMVKGVRYVFFHESPIENDLFFDTILTNRFIEEGFEVHLVDIEDAGPILHFQKRKCRGEIFTRFERRILSDRTLRDKWAPFSYVMVIESD